MSAATPCVEPAPALDAAQGGGRLVEGCLAEPLPGRIGDQGGDKDDRRHEPSGRWNQGQRFETRAPHRRPDRERQVRRGARAGGKRSARRSSTPIRCRSTPTCGCSPPARRLRRRRASRIACSARSTARSTIRSAHGRVGRGTSWRRSAQSRSFSSAAPGLYFRALTEGLSDMPAVPDNVRAAIRAKAEGRATADLHAELARARPGDGVPSEALGPAADPASARSVRRDRPAARLVPGRARRAPPLRPGEWAGLFLAPDRDALYQRIDARFDAMLEAGALDEAAALMERRLDPALPVMRAHGVPTSDRASRRKALARRSGGTRRSLTLATTPSASSPGRGTSSRASTGSRRRRRSRRECARSATCRARSMTAPSRSSIAATGTATAV